MDLLFSLIETALFPSDIKVHNCLSPAYILPVIVEKYTLLSLCLSAFCSGMLNSVPVDAPPPPGCLSLLLRTEYVSSIHRALSLPLLHRGSSPSGLQSKAYEDPGLATNPLLNSLSTGTIRKIPFSLSASNNNHLHSFLQTKFSGFALTERCHSFCCTQDTVAPPEGCLCFLDLWILLGI